jgi:hypothetical protein
MENNAINNIIINEIEALKDLLVLLKEQHDVLIKNDTMKMEEIVDRIQICNKSIATVEVERRKLVNGESMKAVLAKIKDDETHKNYRNIKILLNEVKVQKDSNEMLIKMGLSFSTKMLKIMQPDTKLKTYNSYGRLKK